MGRRRNWRGGISCGTLTAVRCVLAVQPSIGVAWRFIFFVLRAQPRA